VPDEIHLRAEQMGIRADGADVRDVVRVPTECRPEGPAENSFVEVRHLDGDRRVARYLSWIGYGDLDDAEAAEPGKWQLVEPPAPYEARVDWVPFG
jgi:hypothetical protein